MKRKKGQKRRGRPKKKLAINSKKIDSLSSASSDNDVSCEKKDEEINELDIVKHELDDTPDENVTSDNSAEQIIDEHSSNLEQEEIKSECKSGSDTETDSPSVKGPSYYSPLVHDDRRLITMDVDLIKKAIGAVNRLKDDCNIFGDFVANELRILNSHKLRMKLQSRIQKAILKIAEEDEELHNLSKERL